MQIIMKLLCFLWLHIYVKDYFVDNERMRYKNNLVRKCMSCKRIIHWDIEEWDLIK